MGCLLSAGGLGEGVNWLRRSWFFNMILFGNFEFCFLTDGAESSQRYGNYCRNAAAGVCSYSNSKLPLANPTIHASNDAAAQHLPSLLSPMDLSVCAGMGVCVGGCMHMCVCWGVGGQPQMFLRSPSILFFKRVSLARASGIPLPPLGVHHLTKLC